MATINIIFGILSGIFIGVFLPFYISDSQKIRRIERGIKIKSSQGHIKKYLIKEFQKESKFLLLGGMILFSISIIALIVNLANINQASNFISTFFGFLSMSMIIPIIIYYVFRRNKKQLDLEEAINENSFSLFINKLEKDRTRREFFISLNKKFGKDKPKELAEFIYYSIYPPV